MSTWAIIKTQANETQRIGIYTFLKTKIILTVLCETSHWVSPASIVPGDIKGLTIRKMN